MKARIRKTGEIVDIICWCGTYERNDLDNVSYIDSNGNEHSQEKGLNYHWDFEILDDIIDWEQRRYELAKAAMQGFCANPSERIVLANSQNGRKHVLTFLLKNLKIIIDMEITELKVSPPEGYEIDKENSTFECIKFKKKSLTYEDVAKKLFFKSACYSTNSRASIERYATAGSYCGDLNNATSEKQLKKLLAINKLMNVSVFLNCGWKPDWYDDCEYKYYIAIADEGHIRINDISTFNGSFCYFKSEKLAQQAIDILGEDTIRLALSTDW